LALNVYASMGLAIPDDRNKQHFFQLLHVSEILQLLSALRRQSANTAEHELQQHRHHVQRLELLLQHLQYRLKCIDNKITENALEILGRAGETDSAESVFKQFLENGGIPQVDMFNKLMMVYLNRIKLHGIDKEEGRYCLERLECIWDNIGKLSDGPDTYSYNTFLTAKVLVGDIDGAESLFQEMTVAPDRVSFHILLNGYLKAIESKQQQQAETWLSQMISHGIQPDTKTFNTLMSGLVDQMRRSDSQTIGTTANTVLKLADAMKSLAVEKDKYSIGILLACHFLSGNIGQVDRIAADLGLIRSNGMQPIEERDASIATAAGVLTDMYIYNNLINIYLEVGHDDKAMNIYHEMVQKGMKADVVTFGTLIRHSIKRGDVQAAYDYYDKMQQAGISENMHIRNMLVTTFATNEVPGRVIENVVMTGCLLAQKLSKSQSR
jgi:pentatricopeptide repeat protein